jgi:hypothetical protein
MTLMTVMTVMTLYQRKKSEKWRSERAGGEDER